MQTVFILHHEYDLFDRDEVKLIGVYASRQEAEAAAQKSRLQPGFCDWPDGFSIDEYKLGEDHWTDGFARMVNVLMRTQSETGAYAVALCSWHPGDIYKICSIDNPESTKTDFIVGQSIRCTERLVDGATALVAVELRFAEKVEVLMIKGVVSSL